MNIRLLPSSLDEEALLLYMMCATILTAIDSPVRQSLGVVGVRCGRFRRVDLDIGRPGDGDWFPAWTRLGIRRRGCGRLAHSLR